MKMKMKKIRKTNQDKKPTRYFLERLYNLLKVQRSKYKKQKYPEIITWSIDGKGVVILDKQALIKQILGYEFQQSTYKSFTKQMNLYNFKTSKDEDGHSVFYNENFRKDYENIISMMNLKKQIQKQKSELVDYKKEHELLKQQLTELIRYQQILMKAIHAEVKLQKFLFQSVEHLKQKIYERKDRSLFKRRRIYAFFNGFFGNLKSLFISHKFLILNHDLLCQCDFEDMQCRDFSFSRSLYQTPYLTPSGLWSLTQQESIRQLQEMLYDDSNNPISFLTLPKEQQENYIENIWEE